MSIFKVVLTKNQYVHLNRKFCLHRSSSLTYACPGVLAVDPVAELRVHDVWGSGVSSWRVGGY